MFFPENIHTLPQRDFLAWTSHPPWKLYHFCSTLSFKNLVSLRSPPPWNSQLLPLGFQQISRKPYNLKQFHFVGRASKLSCGEFRNQWLLHGVYWEILCWEILNINHSAFCASVIVLVYMVARYLLFSNAAQRALHPGQNWVFKHSFL